jgi:hypothetical protein
MMPKPLPSKIRLLGSTTGAGKSVNPPLFENETDPLEFVVKPEDVVVSCTVTAVGIGMGEPPPIVSRPFMIVPLNCQVPAATFVQVAVLNVPVKTRPAAYALVTLKEPPALNVAILPMLVGPVGLSVPLARVLVLRVTDPRQAPHGVTRELFGIPKPDRPLIANRPDPVRLSFVFGIFEVNVPPVSLNVTLSACKGNCAKTKHRAKVIYLKFFIMWRLIGSAIAPSSRNTQWPQKQQISISPASSVRPDHVCIKTVPNSPDCF